MMARPHLELRGVSKRFRTARGTFDAVDGVTLSFDRGTATAIVGHNGAGKSTLLRLAAGIATPSTGAIVRTQRCVSIIELGAGFHPDLTGEENLALALALHGVPKSDRAGVVRAAIEFADIGDAIFRRVKQYSSGMIARLAGAVAVHSGADLYLIDEVFAVGDSAFQRRMLTHLTDAVRDGATVVVVTHDVDLAMFVSERTVWLSNGAVVADGPTMEVLETYVATLGGVRRSAADSPLHLLDVALLRSSIESQDPIEVEATFDLDTDLSGGEYLEWVMEFRSVAGTSAVWMRSPEERPEDRHFNLFAVSAPIRLPEVPRGRHRMTLRVDSAPFHSTSLDISLIVRNQRGEDLDAVDMRLDVGDDPMRPSLKLAVVEATDSHAAG